MKLNLTFFFILIFFSVFMGCEYGGKKINKEKIEIKDSVNILKNIFVSLNYPKNDSIFTYYVKLKSINDYSLTIETTLIYDSLFLFGDYYLGGNKAVLNQSLIFKFKDSVINKKKFVVNNSVGIEKELRNKKVILPQYVLTSFLYKESKGETLYILYGFGLSNGSNEISSYYSNDGTFMCSTNCSRIKCDTLGNLSETESKYSVFDSTKLKEIYIFPPQSAGQNHL